MTPKLEKQMYERIGLRIAIGRDMAELTQGELAKAIGLTRTSIANIEAGNQRLPIHVAHDIASALRINVLKLLK